MKKILLDPDLNAGGGGGTTPWYSTLPAELQQEASIKTVPDITTLARNYVHAQRLVGADKVALPPKNASPVQMAEFFDKIGRPKTSDAYVLPDTFKLADGLKMEEPMLKEIKDKFHSLGLTNTQGNDLLHYYLDKVNGDFTKTLESQTTARTKATEALRTEWNEAYDSNLDIAKSVVRKFGTPEFMEEINKSEVGNNPNLIKLLCSVGKMMLEDNPLQHGASLLLTNATQAVAEIGKLKQDAEFQKALNNSSSPGHKEAVDKWMELHRTAHPGKQE